MVVVAYECDVFLLVGPFGDDGHFEWGEVLGFVDDAVCEWWGVVVEVLD